MSDQQNLRVEVLEKMSGLATAGLGLVAALAWNDVIKAWFDFLFPSPNGNLIAQTAYAVIITTLVVVVTVQLGRAVNFAKKQLVKDPQNQAK